MADGSPTVRRRRLGLILRSLREKAGMTGEEVGAAIERSGSWVSRVETGRVGLRAATSPICCASTAWTTRS